MDTIRLAHLVSVRVPLSLTHPLQLLLFRETERSLGAAPIDTHENNTTDVLLALSKMDHRVLNRHTFKALAFQFKPAFDDHVGELEGVSGEQRKGQFFVEGRERLEPTSVCLVGGLGI